LFVCLLDDAKRRRRKLVRAVKKYSKPTKRQPLPSERFFPINRLPQDVLAEVFVQCLPKFELGSSIEGLSTEDVAPLLLCSVCSSWRELALSLPRLWQRLSLRFSNTIPMSGSKTEEVIALIHGWIKRSGVLPLTLGLRVRVVVYDDSLVFRAMVEAVLGAFAQYASRWEHFHFTDDISVTLPEFGDMPLLRSFSLRGDYEIAKLQISSWPMLTALSWPLHPTTSSSPSPPWHQLTHLTLGHFMTARETLLVIQSCPKLTELEIESYDDEGDFQDQPLRGLSVVNNCLRKLDLSVGESCAQLLKRLTLPALADITLNFDSCVPRVHRELLRFFTRSKCKLDRLHLMDSEFDDEMLLKCLEHDSCASITDLSIANIFDDPMVTDPVLLSLMDVPSPDNNMLLPNLAHLEFHMCLGGSSGMLGMMLASRCILWDDEDQLKTVKIVCQSLPELDIALMALAEAHGLNVTFDIIPPDHDDF
jgi:hypothetical protein